MISSEIARLIQFSAVSPKNEVPAMPVDSTKSFTSLAIKSGVAAGSGGRVFTIAPKASTLVSSPLSEVVD